MITKYEIKNNNGLCYLKENGKINYDLDLFDEDDNYSSENVYELLKIIYEQEDKAIEHSILLLFSKDYNCNGCIVINHGDDKCVEIKSRHIMLSAMITDSWSCILSHNHPNGIANPSGADIYAHINEKKNLLPFLLLLDEIIACDDDYFSFADEDLSDIDLYDYGLQDIIDEIELDKMIDESCGTPEPDDIIDEPILEYPDEEGMKKICCNNISRKLHKERYDENGRKISN